MATIDSGLKDIFLAGVGALAVTHEKASSILDTLIQKGSLTVEQGKEINSELTHKATETLNSLGKDALLRHIENLSPEERRELLLNVNEMVAKADLADDDKADEV